ncbi:MAG: YicC/YloC family endoribonuclease [Pseudomonadota bacterium]|nr:YicC/YloC family endoribonuclease [Pseudomonadota bacterium]
MGHRSADFQLVWELRTVNQRFLETTFRFLEALKGIEQSLRECARQALTRGKLDASLELEANRADHKFTVNEPLLEALQAGVTAIGLKAPRTAPLSQSQLLA